MQVDAKYSGKTALHCAAAAGKLTIVETLLELGANIEAQVRPIPPVCIGLVGLSVCNVQKFYVQFFPAR